MVYPSRTLSLKSDGAGILLVMVLWLNVGLGVASLLLSLLQVMAPDIYTPVRGFQFVRYYSQIPLGVITVILFLVWMFQLHRDLWALFDLYPITPGESLAQLMIPFYHLWGVWYVFWTLAGRLKSYGGAALKLWLPLLYASGVAIQLLNIFVLKESGDVKVSVSPAMWFTTLGVYLLFSITELEMTRVIRKSVGNRVKEIEGEKILAARPAQ